MLGEVYTNRSMALGVCASYSNVFEPRQPQPKLGGYAGSGLEVPSLFAFDLNLMLNAQENRKLLALSSLVCVRIDDGEQ